MPSMAKITSITLQPSFFPGRPRHTLFVTFNCFAISITSNVISGDWTPTIALLSSLRCLQSYGLAALRSSKKALATRDYSPSPAALPGSQRMPLIDRILLRKRAIIESVNDQLKNLCQIEHTRHRSVNNFMVNIVGALIAYSLQEKKPSLNLNAKQLIEVAC